MILHPPSSPVSLTAPLGSFTGSFSSSLMAFSKGRDFPTWVNVIRELASRPSSDKPAQGLSKVNRTQLESLAWCSRPPGPVAPCVSLPNPQPPSQTLCPSPLSTLAQRQHPALTNTLPTPPACLLHDPIQTLLTFYYILKPSPPAPT